MIKEPFIFPVPVDKHGVKYFTVHSCFRFFHDETVGLWGFWHLSKEGCTASDYSSMIQYFLDFLNLLVEVYGVFVSSCVRNAA